MKRSIAVSSLLCLSLAACAGWSKKKCESTNWEQLGFSQGSTGRQNSGNAYNSTCTKKGASINLNGYNTGYNKGLKTFCSFDAGKSIGANNGELNTMCQKFDDYMKGYGAGLKIFCSSNNGYEAAIEGKDPVNKCLNYKAYSSAYSKGQKDFCSEKNGTRLGEKGMPFPEKCERAGRAFERSFNRGRIGYLEDSLDKKSSDLRNAERDYARVRDDLQDMQYELSRMPRYSNDPNLLRQKEDLSDDIEKARRSRDELREDVDGLEREVNGIKDEISYLRKRI